jgi:hypothetical protein
VITNINLSTRAQQTFSTGDPPLGMAFLSNGQALIATTTGFYLLEPITGRLQLVDSIENIANALPAPHATFPPQVLRTALTTAADGVHIWGIADAGASPQLIFMYDGKTGRLKGEFWTTVPTLLPRVSAAADGSWAMIGWSVFIHSQCGPGFAIRSRYPTAGDNKNVTGHAIDSKSGVIYGQIPDSLQSAGAPSSPTLSVMDSDNLTLREKIYLPENMVGRALLNKAASILYAVSDSGVMILPVGAINKSKRLAVSAEDLLVQSNFCNRNAMKQTFRISDPGGNNTDFTISTTQPGVTISPMNGTTPANVTVTVDPAAFPKTSGTLAVPLAISSYAAINVPPAGGGVLNPPPPAHPRPQL